MKPAHALPLLLLVVPAIVLLRCRSTAVDPPRGSRGSAALARPVSPSAAEAVPAAGAGRACGTRTPRAGGAGGSAAPDAPDDEALEHALLRLAEVPLGVGTPEETGLLLEEALAPFLASDGPLHRVLVLLREEALGGAGPGLALLEVGAVRALVFGALVTNAPPGVPVDLPFPASAPDGPRLLRALLEALPTLRPPVRELLASLLGSVQGGPGVRLVGPDHADLLEELARRHPEAAELLHDLLGEALDDLHPELARVEDARHLQQARSPRLVGSSLARLLETPSGDEALRVAGELFDRRDSPQELRDAITTAVALAAPVEEAARFLSQRTTPAFLDEYCQLGARTGGAEALRDRYYELRILASGDDLARAMLVAGLVDLPRDELLAIAVEDPSARVRAQAWTTLTLAPGFVPSEGVLDLLRMGLAERADARLGVPSYGVLNALGNLLPRLTRRAPQLLPAVRDLLRTIETDPALPAADRGRAAGLLRELQRLSLRFGTPPPVSRITDEGPGMLVASRPLPPPTPFPHRDR